MYSIFLTTMILMLLWFWLMYATRRWASGRKVIVWVMAPIVGVIIGAQVSMFVWRLQYEQQGVTIELSNCTPSEVSPCRFTGTLSYDVYDKALLRLSDGSVMSFERSNIAMMEIPAPVPATN